MEKAADDFAAKFPDSAVRVLLYRSGMNAYQTAGNAQKMMDVGLKVLNLDKDDPEGAHQRCRSPAGADTPTDLDRDKARRVRLIMPSTLWKPLIPIWQSLLAPRLNGWKRTRRPCGQPRSRSLERCSTSRNSTPMPKQIYGRRSREMPRIPDPVVVLRLALALDQQKKYGRCAAASQ